MKRGLPLKGLTRDLKLIVIFSLGMVSDDSVEFVPLEENGIDRSAIMSDSDVSSNERVIEETFEMTWYMKYTKFYKAPVTKFVSNVVSCTQCGRKKTAVRYEWLKSIIIIFCFFIQCLWGFIIDIKIITALQLFTMEVSTTNLKAKAIKFMNA